MKASSLVDIGQEGEGDRVDNQERHPQVISIQVQGPGTSNFCFSIGIRHLEQFDRNIYGWYKSVKLTQLKGSRQKLFCMKIKLPDIVQDDYHVGGRQDEDLAVPRTLPIADLLWGHEAPDVGPSSSFPHTNCRLVTKAHRHLQNAKANNVTISSDIDMQKNHL